MSSYYNEWDPYCVQWLRNLIDAGHLAPGDVDERSIVDVQADELRGYRQCHFFSGIAGWPYALRLSGWPSDLEVWTGSCPCQPLSCAGQRKGDADERHLWPAFFRLIAERRPATVFGEQVSSKDGLEWLSAVRADLEGIGYAVGAADLPACSVGAPHIRRRLFWVAHAECDRWEQRGLHARSCNRSNTQAADYDCNDGPSLGLVYATGEQVGFSGRAREQGSAADIIGPDGLPDIDDDTDELGDSDCAGSSTRSEAAAPVGQGHSTFAASRNPWSDLEWLPCIDGKWRPTKPGLFPLAHGIPGRVGKLRAAGNAIVAPLAAEFVKAAMECIP